MFEEHYETVSSFNAKIQRCEVEKEALYPPVALRF
jgi:hypothetical protein